MNLNLIILKQTNLNKNITFDQLDQSLHKNFDVVFGDGSLFEPKTLD